MLMNLKMPTFVGILTFISMKDTLLEDLKAGKGLYFLAFSFFQIKHILLHKHTNGLDTSYDTKFVLMSSSPFSLRIITSGPAPLRADCVFPFRQVVAQ